MATMMDIVMFNLKRKTKVVLVQLGSPKEPTSKALREFLSKFLGDPRVVDINPWIWKIILYCFVLPFRPRKSAKLYARIWDGKNFPLITNTINFTDNVRKQLKIIDLGNQVEINHAFLLSSPSISDVYNDWEDDLKKGVGATKLLVIPMFPQYSESTIAAGIDALSKELAKRVKIPNFEVITNFHRTHAFIDNSVEQILEKIRTLNNENIQLDHLIISFHGMQKRRVVNKGDDYYVHCFETFKLIKNNLTDYQTVNMTMSFQSRFGSEEWITPYTDDVVKQLITEGNKEIAIYSPSFVVDCLETIDELGFELVHAAKEWGGNIYPIECLNVKQKWCEDFAGFVLTHVEGSGKDKENLEYYLHADEYQEMPPQVLKQT